METGSGTPADPELAILRELHALRQALTHLNDTGQGLRAQQAQLQQQINASSAQWQQARLARQEEQAARAMEQRSLALAAYIRIQEQLERIAARQAEIRTRQQALEANLATVQASQRQSDLYLRDALAQASTSAAAPALPTTQRRASHRYLLWLSGLIVVALVSASLAVAWRLLHPTPPPTTTQGSPVPTPLTTNNTPFYHPASGAPNNQACLANFGHACYSPEQIQQAFRLNPLYRSGFTGAGQTIVVLGSGHTTSLKDDLHHFDQTWGLPDPTLTILEPHGPPASYICPDGIDDLEVENTLDVEWSHAIAPGAKIVLVIGENGGGTPQENCSGDSTLAEDTAYVLNQQLGQVISMSFGFSELGGRSDTPGDQQAEHRYFQEGDSTFQQAASQQVTVIAAAGDDGATTPDGGGPNSYWNRPSLAWPASDPNVLSVGGTRLSLDASNNYQNEVVWDESGFGATGGGLSAVFAEPDYQRSVPNQALFQGKRGIPDVAFPADNFLVYDSTSPGLLGQINPAWQHWDIIGGTSASAPSWAGIVAIADQVRGQPLGLLQPILYRLQGKGMHDITSGNNSFHGVTGYSAQQGFDLVSGWGTPIADQFIPDLVEAANQS